MSAAPVSRVSVVVEYADGQVTRMSCDRPAHAELEVNYSPYGGFPYSAVASSRPYAYAGAPPELRLDVRPGCAPAVVETVEGAAIATARGLQYAVSYREEYPEALQHARKRAREQLAIATLDAGCVMLALPGETTTPGPFGETTIEFTVPVAPAA